MHLHNKISFPGNHSVQKRSETESPRGCAQELCLGNTGSRQPLKALQSAHCTEGLMGDCREVTQASNDREGWLLSLPSRLGEQGQIHRHARKEGVIVNSEKITDD